MTAIRGRESLALLRRGTAVVLGMPIPVRAQDSSDNLARLDRQQ